MHFLIHSYTFFIMFPTLFIESPAVLAGLHRSEVLSQQRLQQGGPQDHGARDEKPFHLSKLSKSILRARNLFFESFETSFEPSKGL